MNLTKEQYDRITTRLDKHSLVVTELTQNIKDLEGQLDYHRTGMAALYERVEELENIINEELG